MKGLIIAAGEGSRLSHRGDSKPLVPLLELPLIERVILNAKGEGITDFYIVTGYNGEKLRNHLDQFARNRDLKITHFINNQWEKENGLSVLAAKKEINENFILLMSDHIFDKSILEDLMQEKVADGEIILAVDYNLKNKTVDVDDVTKVLVDDKNRIVNIGKNIKEYNAYDTGIFLCSPAIFEALEESSDNGDTSLSAGIKILAKQKKSRVFDIKGKYWIDVDDENAFKKAENILLANLKKASDGPVSRYLNRPFSIRISKYLLKKSIKEKDKKAEVISLINLGGLYFENKKYSIAEKNYIKALKIVREKKLKLKEPGLLKSLGLLKIEEYDFQPAIDYFLEALELTSKSNKRVFRWMCFRRW